MVFVQCEDYGFFKPYVQALWQSATEHVKGSSDLSSEEREALQVELDSLSVKMDRLQEKISGLDKGTDPVQSV
jgi:hypothetical protein